MFQSQRSISIKHQILGKLHLNEIENNPICPIKKLPQMRVTKIIKQFPSIIEQEIFYTASIKRIKPYKTQKLIFIENDDFLISAVLRSASYRQLQSKFLEIRTNFNAQKKKLKKQIKHLDQSAKLENQKAGNLCSKFMELDTNFGQLENQYFEIKRQNYELKSQLSVRRGPQNELNQNIFFEQSQTIDIDQMSYEQILELEERLGKANVGLTNKRISNLKTKNFKSLTIQKNLKEEINCCICCQIIESQEAVVELSCAHVHHSECIQRWLKIKRFCPLCKAEVNLEEQ